MQAQTSEKRKLDDQTFFSPLVSPLSFSFQGQAIGWHLACSHRMFKAHGTMTLWPLHCAFHTLSCPILVALGSWCVIFQQPVPSTRPVLVGRRKPLLSILRSWFFFFLRGGNCYNYSESFCMQIQFSLGEIYILYKESPCQKYTQCFSAPVFKSDTHAQELHSLWMCARPGLDTLFIKERTIQCSL